MALIGTGGEQMANLFTVKSEQARMAKLRAADGKKPAAAAKPTGPSPADRVALAQARLSKMVAAKAARKVAEAAAAKAISDAAAASAAEDSLEEEQT